MATWIFSGDLELEVGGRPPYLRNIYVELTDLEMRAGSATWEAIYSGLLRTAETEVIKDHRLLGGYSLHFNGDLYQKKEAPPEFHELLSTATESLYPAREHAETMVDRDYSFDDMDEEEIEEVRATWSDRVDELRNAIDELETMSHDAEYDG